MIWKTKRIRRKRNASSDVKRRAAMPQQLERRELLAADPIHVGVVYLETDYLESDNDVGEDSRGDRFLLSFEGGAPDTELKQLRIRTDKDGDGISVGDPIFDTELGGRGKRGAHVGVTHPPPSDPSGCGRDGVGDGAPGRPGRRVEPPG